MKSVTLHTNKFIIRELEPGDKKAFVRLYQDEQVSKYLTKQTIQADEEKFDAAVLAYQSLTGLGRWGIFDPVNDNFMGVATLKPADAEPERIELGYVLHYDYWGRGLAKEIAEALLKYGFGILDLKEICAVTDPENLISQSILMKIGFVKQDTVFWYGKHVPFFTIKNAKSGVEFLE